MLVNLLSGTLDTEPSLLSSFLEPTQPSNPDLISWEVNKLTFNAGHGCGQQGQWGDGGSRLLDSPGAWVTVGMESHFLVLSLSILKWKEEPTGGISQREIKWVTGTGAQVLYGESTSPHSHPQDPSSGDSHMQEAHALAECTEAGTGFRTTAVLVLGSSPDLGLPGSPLTAGQLTREKCTSSSST